MVIMFRTGWITRPAENALRAASIAVMRSSHSRTARTSSSSRYITAGQPSAGPDSADPVRRGRAGFASRARPLDTARLEPPAELLERGGFDLPHALSRHTHAVTDRLERQ